MSNREGISGMDYQRVIVNDGDLSGRWAVARSGDRILVFVARSHASPRVWTEVESHLRALVALA